jgi:membrane-bound serine protease (ClpP class)
MVEVGVALVLVGAALLVAEAHVPGGVLGAAGGAALAVGAALAIAGAGAGAAVVAG